MAIIAPFRGLRFNPDKITRMEEVVTPPYDVIDERAKAAYLAKNPHNMVQLDLSKKGDAKELSEERYLRARHLFEQWQAEQILIQDQEPAIYVYFTDYPHPSGNRLTRKGFISLLRLSDFADGIVKPHEKTFANVTSDRLRLLDTCQAQFSQIFSIYSDEEGAIMAALEAARPEEPACSVEDQDGCRHTIWAVTAPAVIAQVKKLLEAKPVYIADGHHRYTTALQFRDLMTKRLGSLPAGSPYNHTAMYLCPMEDPGLSVLPTHRLVRFPANRWPNISTEAFIEKLVPGFTAEEMTGGSREILVAEVLSRIDENNRTAASQGRKIMFGLYHPADDRCLLLTLKDGVMAAAGKQPKVLQELDVVVLSDLIFKQLLVIDLEQGGTDSIEYFSDPDDALDVAVKEASEGKDSASVLFLLNSTTVAQVKAVADERLIMPHKSTYFYPKLLTGLLINKINGQDTVG